MTSDDDGSDSGDEAGRRSLKPHPGHQRASYGSASTSRNKGNKKKEVENPVGVPAAERTAAVNGNGEGSGSEDGTAVDAREFHSSDDDDDGQVARTTQELQMEKAMAAIRKASTPVSAQEGEEDRVEDRGVDEATEAGRGEDEGMDVEDEERGGHENVDREHAATHNPSAVGGRGSAVATGSNPVPEASGSQGDHGPKSCSPELLNFKALGPFIKSEGWKCVHGRGLYSWIYVIPGKKGKSGEMGVDYLVSEKDVVQHVCGDEQMLARYEAYLQKTAMAKTIARGPASGASLGVAAERAEGSFLGGQGTANDPSKASSGRGKRKVRDETNASSSAEPSAPSNAKTTRSAPSQQQPRGGKKQQSNNKASRRRKVEKLAVQPQEGEVDWAQKWRDEWPKLNEEGWHWVYGTGLVMDCVYLKPGVSRKDGRLGIDMFYSREAVLEHVLKPALVATDPAERDRESDSDTESKVVEPQPLQEWSLAKHRETRPRRRGLAETKTPTAEVINLPSRWAGRKTSRLPPAHAVQGGRSSSRDSSAGAPGKGNGQSASRGSGGSLQSIAQGKVKEGRGRPHKFPQAEAVSDPTVKRLPVGGSKQPSREVHDRGKYEQPRKVESCEDSADESQDEMENAATQPQFELSSAINLAKLASRQAGGVSPAASAAAAAFGVACDTASGKVSCGHSGRAVGETVSPAVGETASSAHTAVGTREGAGRTPKAGLTRASSASSSKRPRSTHDSPTPSVDGGNGSGNNATKSVVDRTPKRKSAVNSPLSSSSSVQGGGGSRTKKQKSPTMESGVRSSSRRIIAGPFAGLGVIITGLRGDAREKIQANIQKLGGEVVDILKSSASGEWRKLLLNEAALVVAGRERKEFVASDDGGSTMSEAGGTPDSASIARSRRMIAVATPDSDRTPKFQLAMAAGMPIVHPSYVAACRSMATEVETAGYLLPFGRSALLDRGLIMPLRQARDRPFQGKNIMLCMDGQGIEKTTLDNWVLTLTVAGATVTLLQEGSGERKGTGRGMGVAASWSTLEVALDLLKQGQIFCVIGPKRIDGDPVSASSTAVEEAAVQAGTPAGSLEWAVQCMAHGRLLLPNAGTCPWFPLGAAGGRSGGGGSLAKSGGMDKKGKGRGGGKRGVRGRRGGRGSAGRGRSSGREVGPFHVHLSGGKRYVAGDYVSLEKRGIAASNTNGVAAAGAAAGADNHPRVARVNSFRREAGGKVWVAVTAMKRGDGAKVLVASGGEGDKEEEEVGEDMLGARVLALTKLEMEATQLYSLSDSGIFCLRD